MFIGEAGRRAYEEAMSKNAPMIVGIDTALGLDQTAYCLKCSRCGYFKLTAGDPPAGCPNCGNKSCLINQEVIPNDNI